MQVSFYIINRITSIWWNTITTLLNMHAWIENLINETTFLKILKYFTITLGKFITDVSAVIWKYSAVAKALSNVFSSNYSGLKGFFFVGFFLFVYLFFFPSSEQKSELSFLAAVCLLMIFFLVQRRCSLVSKIAMVLGLLGVYSYRAAIGNVIFPWQHASKDISK